jgi:poly(3-hydroxyalkanoate) depolymerase
MDAPEVQFVDADGVRLRVRDSPVPGRRVPLLLISGIGASLDIAEPFERELLAAGVPTITYDAPGVGESATYLRPRRMGGVARIAERLVAALGYPEIDVFGVSYGGVVAQQLARQAPRLVRRLVLAATGPGVGGVPGSPQVLWAMATPRRYYQPDYYRRVAPSIYGGTSRHDPEALLHKSLARFTHKPTSAGYLAQLYSLSGWTSVPWLCRLRQPTLVMAGDDDPIVPLINAHILARLIPDSRLQVVRGGGHLFILEDPARAASSVATFLTAQTSASTPD